MPYTGDMVYVLSSTEADDAEEVREALEDICLGEIEVLYDCESAVYAIKELIS